MDNVQLLISKYLDAELSDQDFDQLSDLLRTDSNVVDRFVLASFLHSHLNEWMDQQRVQDDAMGGPLAASAANGRRSQHRAAGLSADELDCLCPELAEDHEPAARRMRFWLQSSIVRVAAALLLAASIALAGYIFATRPVVVAQLTEANGCQWAADETDTAVGALLNSGEQLQLVQGRALVTFVNGAQVLLEGPTSMRLDSAAEVYVHHGRIAAKVPTQAIGFTVATSPARFVDRGTAFTLKLDANEAFDLYVFEGLVELQLDERFGEAAHQPVQVAEVHAFHFDLERGDVVALPFNQGEKMPF